MLDHTELFCTLDDFCKVFEPFYRQALKADSDNIFMIDSTSMPVCHNKRIRQHRTFKQYAARAKTSMGWFYGFKLHLVINRACEIVSAWITSGNISDVSMMKALLLNRNIQGKVIRAISAVKNKRIYSSMAAM